jgi:hypothetical protein
MRAVAGIFLLVLAAIIGSAEFMAITHSEVAEHLAHVDLWSSTSSQSFFFSDFSSAEFRCCESVE